MGNRHSSPDEKLLAAMGKYNEELMKAVDAARPSSRRTTC